LLPNKYIVEFDNGVIV